MVCAAASASPWWMGAFDADKAYKDSKLCNVLLGRD